MRQLWRRRDFRLLLLGQTASAFGDWMGTIGFMALSLALTDSALAVGIVLVLRLLPAVLAGPLAVRLVDRFDRRRTMMTMDLARGAVAAAVPFVSAIWWVYGSALLLELGSVAFLPARDSSIPDLVADEDLTLANGLVLATSYGTIPLGAGAVALATALLAQQSGLARGGVAVAFWIDAATFVVSFACIRPLTALSKQSVELQPDSEEPVRADRFLSALRIPLVRAVAPLALAVALGLGALFSLGIVFVRDILGADNTAFSLLVVLFGVGAAAGLACLPLLRDRGLGMVRVCIVGQGAVIALMSLSPNLWWADVGAVVFAFFTAVSLALAMSVLQRSLDGQPRVQAFALFHVLIRVGLGLGAIGAAVAADVVRGVSWPVVGQLPPVRLVLGCSGLVVAVLAITLRARFFSGAALARRSAAELAQDSSVDDGDRLRR